MFIGLQHSSGIIPILPHGASAPASAVQAAMGKTGNDQIDGNFSCELQDEMRLNKVVILPELFL